MLRFSHYRLFESEIAGASLRGVLPSVPCGDMGRETIMGPLPRGPVMDPRPLTPEEIRFRELARWVLESSSEEWEAKAGRNLKDFAKVRL